MHFKSGASDQAVGGARPARCREKESLGAACCGSEEYQVTIRGVLTRLNRAAASAGRCNAWQIWQAGSGPFVCWWNREPPAAKYSKAAQASSARARRTTVRPKMASGRYILSTLYLSTFDGRKS